MEESPMIIMFIFSGICFLGGLISGFLISSSKPKEENAGQD